METSVPTLPPKTRVRLRSHPVPSLKNEVEWYVGNISREKANELMKDKPDGSFLVRDASSGMNEYTLVVRKSGTNKLIRIFQNHEGRFGFCDPCTFESVQELIQFHRTAPLTKFNPKLDVVLQYPISLTSKRVELVNVTHEINGDRLSAEEQLKEVDRILKSRSQLYHNYHQNYLKNLQEIQHKKQLLNAFEEAVALLEDQLDLHEKFHNKAHRHEISRLKENYELLKEKLASIQKTQSELQADLETDITCSRQLDCWMNALKPELRELRSTRESLSLSVILH